MHEMVHMFPEQSTFPKQLCAPLQSIDPVPASLLTPIGQDEPPLHVAVHWSPWHSTAPAQLDIPEQVSSSMLPPPRTLPPQLRSPMQRTWHCWPVPHRTSPAHDPASMQPMSQFVAFEQSTTPWQLRWPHMTEQGIPLGQTTSEAHAPEAPQSNTQPVCGSHDVPPLARQVMHAIAPAPPVPAP